MRNMILSAIILLLAAPAFAEKLYVHLTATDEDGRATVEMTLPIAFVKKAAEVLAKSDFRGHCQIEIDHHDFDVEDMHAVARALRNGEEPVLAGSRGEELRFRRLGDQVEIVADDGWDQVVTRVPTELFLVTFRDDRRIDFAAALQMLAARGGGEILVASGEDERVRVWIDGAKAIRGGVR